MLQESVTNKQFLKQNKKNNNKTEATLNQKEINT